MPGGLAARRQVVEPRFCRIAQDLADRVRAHVRQQLRTGRRAELVVDDSKPLALLGQPQHGLREIAAARGIDPAGAKDQMSRAMLGDQLLAL
jgi:hypothetical protein